MEESSTGSQKSRRNLTALNCKIFSLYFPPYVNGLVSFTIGLKAVFAYLVDLFKRGFLQTNLITQRLVEFHCFAETRLIGNKLPNPAFSLQLFLFLLASTTRQTQERFLKMYSEEITYKDLNPNLGVCLHKEPLNIWGVLFKALLGGVWDLKALRRCPTRRTAERFQASPFLSPWKRGDFAGKYRHNISVEGLNLQSKCVFSVQIFF